MYLIADSNENNSYSFSPSELYVDADGNCFEETYSTRQCAEEHGGDALEQSVHSLGYYIENGYWNVSGSTIAERWEGWITWTAK
jgi:hypothetical protein